MTWPADEGGSAVVISENLVENLVEEWESADVISENLVGNLEGDAFRQIACDMARQKVS